MNIKAIINDILIANEINQEELAKILQITPVTLSHWVTGKALPRKEVLKRLMELYSDAKGKEMAAQKKEALSVYKFLKSGSFDMFRKNMLSEEVLKQISVLILENESSVEWQSLIKKILLGLPVETRVYDWNFGSLVQHFPSTEVVKIFKTIGQTSPFYNSIGLSWVFGEFGIKDVFIIDYLRSVVLWASDSDAWWRSAFSLEKLGSDEAINLLKRSLKQTSLKSIDFYLQNLQDKKSVIALLLLCNVENIENKIYPKLKELFLETKDRSVLINCCWLIGRFSLFDEGIFEKLITLSRSEDYEIKYYTFFALQYNTSEKLRPFLEAAMSDNDPLIRKIATRAVRHIAHESSLSIVESRLVKEDDPLVISELTQTIYFFKNPDSKTQMLLSQKVLKNENGLIVDETDKWYKDASIYNIFSQAEDPQNVCFDIIKKIIGERQIVNPIDIATGTGRSLWQIMDKFSFFGVLYGVDLSRQMCEYVTTAVRRERKFTHPIKVIQSSIVDSLNHIKEKSSFIVSSFGFPSHVSDHILCLSELKTIYNLLSENGVFVTIGWDETFNDELNEMWFKYIPDTIQACSFEEWRSIRASSILSPRNCGLSWEKKGIVVPLQFRSLSDSAIVMGYLFGRDAAQYVIKHKKTEWLMSLGITMNTKEEIKKIIDTYEKRN
ncbi:MAG: helix-turn-helix domain-containing protein [Candidatus Parcubacteria bacterium]|nr:helix-turn-helix domain-containing protein [Candidatus Parcubacteria bacterium]